MITGKKFLEAFKNSVDSFIESEVPVSMKTRSINQAYENLEKTLNESHFGLSEEYISEALSGAKQYLKNKSEETGVDYNPVENTD